jgi:transcriptional regulator with XRE-family HTH domain
MRPKTSAKRLSGTTPEQVLGRALRTAREARTLSQDALAHSTGYSRNYIGQIERGEKNPSLRTILDLADALEVSAASLISTVEAQRRRKDRQ